MRRTLFVTGLLALLAWPSVIRAQTLGDVARAEEARRALVIHPAKVYTNNDLRRDGRESTPDPAPAAQPTTAKPADPATGKPAVTSSATTSKPAQPAPADDSKKDEKYWRDRIASARDTLTHDKVLLDALESRINALMTDFVNTSDPAQRAVVENNRKTALAEKDRLNKDIDNQTKAIAAIEEEARKAGVPSSWLR
jgi:hypothetical protein